MSAERFEPIPTCEVPPPVLEHPARLRGQTDPLPRVLLQAAGSDLHERRLLALAAGFVLLALLEAMVLWRLPGRGPLVVYLEPSRERLVEVCP